MPAGRAKQRASSIEKMKWLISVCVAIIACCLWPATTLAQRDRFVRYSCTGAADSGDHSGVAAARRRLPILKTEWDSTRTYNVAVVLVAFADRDFSSEEPYDFYQRIFNEEGYNEGRGAGCVADYFRCQSAGWFRPHFDIYGPVKLEYNCTDYGNYGSGAFNAATRLLIDSLGVDFTPYDWNGDKTVEHIIFIYAGFGGNETANKDKGYIWPNTSAFSTINKGNLRITYYSASAELWSNSRSCGIGTICHEYTHTLGLPDLYPTASSEYSVVDEWDLMDGGNFVNNGWCPPNFSAHEKMLLGWYTPLELTEPTVVEDMKPLSEGGDAYIVRTEDANEFFILENRQWTGWDLRTPGHGLLIAHVDFDPFVWDNNSVNSSPQYHRYDYLHADNRSYTDWETIIGDENPRVGGHSRILSGTPYPYVTDSTENRSLTDTSVPAATTFRGSGLLGQPITDIAETEGVVSFHFRDSIPDRLTTVRRDDRLPTGTVVYDLTGRRTKATQRGIYIRNGKKIIIQ